MRSLAMAVLLVAGCGGASEPVDPASGSNDPNGVAQGTPLERDFAIQAGRIATEYQAWGRVDDELRWAPYLCRQPMPGSAYVSASNHADTHGQKLYSVFVKARADYPEASKPGQVVVKESFVPEIVNAVVPYNYGNGSNIEADHFSPYAVKDGVIYKAGAPAGLFLMFKVDPASTRTDRGWVYATVAPTGQVTAAGRIASCMTCHEEAPHDRLFGVPQSPH